MRKKKHYASVTKCIFHPEQKSCLSCGTRLKRYATLSQRTVITLSGPMRVVHCGYRCPNLGCSSPERVYRSAQADALALPGFTFGLDIVVLVGRLKLGSHQTLDEAHEAISNRLKAHHMTLSRRNVMYLFEAYCALLKAAHQCRDDPTYHQWLAQVQENGGILVSIDGIQPEKGNETIYVVRDVLTARVLNAENVTTSDKAAMKRVLEPVLALQVKVLGVISDAQSSSRDAIAELWPEVPHQTCQFHYLQEAARPIFEVDRSMRAKMRKSLGDKLRPIRPQIEQHLHTRLQAETIGGQVEQQQLEVLYDYILAAQASSQLDGSLPFDYPGVTGYDALEDLAESLARVEKKGSTVDGH